MSGYFFENQSPNLAMSVIFLKISTKSENVRLIRGGGLFLTLRYCKSKLEIIIRKGKLKIIIRKGKLKIIFEHIMFRDPFSKFFGKTRIAGLSRVPKSLLASWWILRALEIRWVTRLIEFHCGSSRFWKFCLRKKYWILSGCIPAPCRFFKNPDFGVGTARNGLITAWREGHCYWGALGVRDGIQWVAQYEIYQF